MEKGRKRRREFIEKLIKGEVIVIGPRRPPEKILSLPRNWLERRQKRRLERIKRRGEIERYMHEREEEFIRLGIHFVSSQRKEALERRIRAIRRLEKIGDLTHEEAQRIIRGLRARLEAKE